MNYIYTELGQILTGNLKSMDDTSLYNHSIFETILIDLFLEFIFSIKVLAKTIDDSVVMHDTLKEIIKHSPSTHQ